MRTRRGCGCRPGSPATGRPSTANVRAGGRLEAHGAPSSAKVACALAARSISSGMPWTTGWASSPSPSQVTCSALISCGSGAVRMASSTEVNAPVSPKEHSSGSPERRAASRFSSRSVRPKASRRSPCRCGGDHLVLGVEKPDLAQGAVDRHGGALLFRGAQREGAEQGLPGRGADADHGGVVTLGVVGAVQVGFNRGDVGNGVRAGQVQSGGNRVGQRVGGHAVHHVGAIQAAFARPA